jgi:dipeptidyl aminopeptidase/acylaminoacyl peptidase
MATRMRGSIIAISFGLVAGLAAAAPQPIESFARMPQMRDVTISPDGHYVAFVSAMDDASVVMTYDAKAKSAFKRIAASEPGRFDVERCGWANQERVICSLVGNIRGRNYAEVPFFRNMSVDANGTNIKTLDVLAENGNMMARTTTPQNLNGAASAGKVGGNAASGNFGFGTYGQKSGRTFDYFGGQRSDQMLDSLPEEHDKVLIQTNYEGNSFPSVLSLNVYTGRREVRVRANPPIRNFLTDGQGATVMGWGVSGKLDASYFSRSAAGGEWSPLTKLAAFTGDRLLLPLGVAPDEKIAYAFGDFEGRRALWAVDLADQRAPEVLVKHASVDVGSSMLTNDRRFFGVRYDLDRPLAYYSDAALSETLKEINTQFPARFSMVVDMTVDDKTLIVKSFSDTDEATYYLYDRDENKLKRLGQAYPELKPESLGTMQPIKYKAADGAEIRGYLTIPNGGAAEKLPLVVLPHDGPAERDVWEFSYLRNFLANRGYAVLQMNFRGSGGYGQKWKGDANANWGGVAYSDIADATRWAVAQGIADPKRICIAGTGFGGYAALLGAERNSDLFRCSISINGISDLQMLKDNAAMFGPADEAFVAEQLGSDKSALIQQSPVENAAGISIPVLLVHGDLDWRVQIDHSRKMESVLKKLKKNYKAVYIKGAGHELDRKSDRMTLLKEVEDFLQKNIGAGAT